MLILGLDGISSCICLNCNESLVRKNLQRTKTFLNSVIKKFFTKLANLEKYVISGFDFFCVKVNVDLKFILNGSVGKDLKSLFWVYTFLNKETFLHLGNGGNYSNTTI